MFIHLHEIPSAQDASPSSSLEPAVWKWSNKQHSRDVWKRGGAQRWERQKKFAQVTRKTGIAWLVSSFWQLFLGQATWHEGGGHTRPRWPRHHAQGPAQPCEFCTGSRYVHSTICDSGKMSLGLFHRFRLYLGLKIVCNCRCSYKLLANE